MIASQRHLFDIPAEVAYLNCAYMGPLSRAVAAAGAEGIARKVRPWSLTAGDFFTESERARALFAALIGARPGDCAIVPAVSYGVAVAARNLALSPGQRVVLLAEQFPSNVYGWQVAAARAGASVVTVERGAAGGWTGPLLEAIDERTAVVAVPHCHWTDGSLVDLVRVGERARAAGSALVVDLTQSAGALPFECAAVRPDYLVAACYKWLLGPYSLGFLYVAPHRQEGEPLEESWIARRASEDFARLVDYQRDYQPGARRYDMGERASFHLLPMAVRALEQILDWGVESIAATLAARTRSIAARAAALGFASLPEGQRAGHFLGLRPPGGVPAGLVERLREHQVHVSVRGDTVRVTPHVYNTDADEQRLLAALAG